MKLKVVLLLGFVLALNLTIPSLPLLAQENHQSGTASSNPMVHSAENDQVKLTVNLNPGVSMVGHLTKITGQVIDKATGLPVTSTLVKIDAHHIEDDKTMLHTEFVSTDGSFSFDNQFFDGAEHRLTFTVEPTAASSIKFTSVSTEFPVEVMGVQPPTDVKVKTIIFLLLVVALGMVAGVFTAKSLKSRQSRRLIPATD